MYDMIPVDEFEGRKVRCVQCKRVIKEAACVLGDEYYCMECIDDEDAAITEEAREFALEHCKITRELPRYDERCEYGCTPEEYEAGERESYTPNSHLCYCRHTCTNYEELIKGLDRDEPADVTVYWAIKERINELLTEKIEEMWLGGDADQDDDSNDWDVE
jgi:hypothetical protein